DGAVLGLGGPQLAAFARAEAPARRARRRVGDNRRMPESRSRIDVPIDARDAPGDFAHRHEVEVRLSDTAAMGHVNNARTLPYVEIARVAYYEQVTGNPLPIGAHGAEEGMILAEIRMTYRSPAFYGETLTVESRVERIGRSSFG